MRSTMGVSHGANQSSFSACRAHHAWGSRAASSYTAGSLSSARSRNSAEGSNVSTSSSSASSRSSASPPVVGVDSVAMSAFLQRLLNGTTGSTVRPKVEFVTAANDAYHAAIAVARPT